MVYRSKGHASMSDWLTAHGNKTENSASSKKDAEFLNYTKGSYLRHNFNTFVSYTVNHRRKERF